jgi:2-methylcitrate dehydratase
VLAAAEYVHRNGRDLITATVLAYEIFLRIDDIFHNMGFDQTTFCCLASAVAAGRLFRLTPEQLSHCISIAIVPNNALRLSRMGHLSMWKVAATGQAGRGGIFAAQLARAGMEGPHMPFEGRSGWFDHVALEKLSLDTLGGKTTRFKILDTSLKFRPSVGLGIAPILASEKIAPLNIRDVKEVTLEVYKKAKTNIGSGPQHWHPDSKESADHSAPYLVATTLKDGTMTPRSYNDAHLSDREVRGLMEKIRVVENEEFTKAYERAPAEHKARVTVVMNSGERLVGETGGGAEELATPKTNEQIEEKFRGLTEDYLGAKRVKLILERLWRLEDLGDVASIPPDFVLA